MTLAELINSEPLNAARTDAEVLAWLNESVNTFMDVGWLDLCMWVAQHAYRPTLVTAASIGTDAQKTAAQHVLDCIAAGQPLSASDSRVRAVVASAIPAGQPRTDLLALATKTMTRWSTVVSEMDDPSKLYWIQVARNG